MIVKFVGGTLDGEEAEQDGWVLEFHSPLYEGRGAVKQNDWFTYQFPAEVYEMDRENGCYRYVRTEHPLDDRSVS